MRTAILDFDYTLFDTAAFRDSIRDGLAAVGVDAGSFDATYAAVLADGGMERRYSPQDHASYLARLCGGDAADYAASIRATADGCGRHLYPGALAFLDRLRDAGYEIRLLTCGDTEWQLQKVAGCGLDGVFEDIVATPEPKGRSLARAVAGAAQDVVVINDNPDEMLAMASSFPRFRYLLKRGPMVPPEDFPFPIGEDFDELFRLCA
jgi:phosphoglycolate phosphatase-like HAD superfamily hydrolase